MHQSRCNGFAPKPVALSVIVAAWQRGWTKAQIGFAAGVSWQAISERLNKYEAVHGVIPRKQRPGPFRSFKTMWRCAECGQQEWSKKSRLKHGERHFCSRRCFTFYHRVISDDIVECVIALRVECNTWTDIAKVSGFSQQVLQARIWKYLYARNQLTYDVVASIWAPYPHKGQGQGRPPAWRWLEIAYGIYCTRHGAMLGPRYEGMNQTPWGSVIVRAPDCLWRSGEP